MKRQRAFTLVELMVVVAIIALAASLAAMGLRPNRAERLRSVTRTLLGVSHEARQSAITLRQSSRLRLVNGASGGYPPTIIAETRDPTQATKSNTAWLPLGGTITLPDNSYLCYAGSTDLGTLSTPTCPMSANQNVCFAAATGSVTVQASGTDCNDATAATGASIYLETSDAKTKLKVVYFSLTGLPKLIDTW